MENIYGCIIHTQNTLYMKLAAGALIALLLVTVSLIMGFKYISAEAAITKAGQHAHFEKVSLPDKIGSISLPEGFTRMPVQPGSFAEYLRGISLRKNNTVYLYNGQPAGGQEMHYAVLDISTGNKDLQQCADAIMRLRAEYYFANKQYGNINFPEGQRSSYSFKSFANLKHCFTHECLMDFMEIVFINCGTYTVDEMSKPVTMQNMQPGDVFVKAGSPGHAMIVVDMAENRNGSKIYLLAQSYMPAQDMHIVINPNSSALSPWYSVNSDEKIITPGWVFNNTQLKRWK